MEKFKNPHGDSFQFLQGRLRT